jgi:oligopeptidase B
MAFAVDTVGRRYSTIRFKDLGTGEFLDDVIDSVTANMAWANDGRTLFYAKQTRPPVYPRPYQIYRHVLGSDPKEDELVHEESGERSRCLVWSRDGYLVIETWGPSGNEWRFLDADQPDGAFKLFLPTTSTYGRTTAGLRTSS